MLQSLNIDNYALIQHLEFKPDLQGLNIITGETGAGKSILVGALGLILGERADLKVLKNPDKKCVVEASFDLSKHQSYSKFILEHDLDELHPAIIRREISPSGRSRAFINDSPVSLNQMKQLGSTLVDVHSQHQNFKLNESDFQFKILDLFAKNTELLTQYQDEFEKYQTTSKQLKELKDKIDAFEKEIDYKKFLFEELEKANLHELNPSEIEAKLLGLENAEEIQNLGYSSSQILEEDENSVNNQLASVINGLDKLAMVHPTIAQIVKNLNSAKLEIEEAALDLRGVAENSDIDPEKVNELNEQIHLYRSLLNKHKVLDVSQLIQIQEELDNELQEMGSNTNRLEELETLVNKHFNSAKEIANQMSEKRYEAIGEIQATWRNDLEQLGMPNAEIQFQLSDLESLNKWGCDDLQINFSSNKGSAFQPLHKVASGGELSRIMLIVKSYLANIGTLPTMVLDEIDTGVSGETAKRVAEMMANLSKKHQIITITHLPQIAAKGTKHFYVYKSDDVDVTSSHLRELNEMERVEEIAKMLSGENPSDFAIKNAKELMQI